MQKTRPRGKGGARSEEEVATARDQPVPGRAAAEGRAIPGQAAAPAHPATGRDASVPDHDGGTTDRDGTPPGPHAAVSAPAS